MRRHSQMPTFGHRSPIGREHFRFHDQSVAILHQQIPPADDRSARASRETVTEYVILLLIFSSHAFSYLSRGLGVIFQHPVNGQRDTAGVDYPTVKFSHRSTNLILLSIAALAVGLPIFWVEGGCTWLQTRVFPPRRPRIMPLNSVWIEAPSLPVSWHRGGWFGCGLSHSGTANYCRLVGADGKVVYGGEYLSCATHSPIAEEDIHLVPPRSSGEAWLFSER